MTTTSVITALAVCGCGHEGRLGIGSTAPHTQHEVVLIDDFLPSPSSASSAPASSSPVRDGAVRGVIRDVACGAYHTLVLTSDGLYGWGRHQEGQLGVGAISPDSVRLAAAAGLHADNDTTGTRNGSAGVIYGIYSRPTPIPFFDLIRYDDEDDRDRVEHEGESPAEEMVAVYCGADHSLIRTTRALYVTGSNADGQLGLGHTTTLFRWTRLTHVPGPRESLPGDLSLPAFTRADGATVRVLYGRLTHVSCGTHHTLLALADVLVLEHEPHGRQGGATPQLTRHALLVLSCGRGDYGELGYNTEVCSADGSSEKQKQQQQLQLPSSTRHYAFAWAAAKNAKPRRPPHSDPFLRPVELPAGAVQEALDSSTAAAVHDAVLLASAKSAGRFRLSAAPAWEYVAASLSCTETSRGEESGDVAVTALQAMHHHSAVTLRTAKTAQNSDRDSSGGPSTPVPVPPSSCSACRVLHWGCYYCGAIEDAAAATPRPLCDDDGDDDACNGSGHLEGAAQVRWGVHAGDEVLFRYATTSPTGTASGGGDVGAPVLQVMGRGNLGRGSSDDEAQAWANINIGAPSLSVSSMAGRSHFLLSVAAATPAAHTPHDENTSDGVHADAAPTAAVFGFGENLHGQIGGPFERHAVDGETVAETAEEEEDALVRPRVVLRIGDVLRRASTATKAAVQAPAHAAEVAASGGAAERWAVANIRAVGAGARHSVFVVDVRPAAES